MTDEFFSPEVRRKTRHVWQHRWINANVVASHLVGALIIIAGMEILELILTHGNPVKIFAGLPYEIEVSWLFDAGDLFILVAFLVRGVIAVWTSEGE